MKAAIVHSFGQPLEEVFELHPTGAIGSARVAAPA